MSGSSEFFCPSEDCLATTASQHSPCDCFDSIVARIASRYKTSGCALLSYSSADATRVLACSGSVSKEMLETSNCGPCGTGLFDHRVHRRAPIIIDNLALIGRFSGDPLVAGQPGLRFYASVPVFNPDGKAVAILSIYDDKPRCGFNLQKCGPLRKAAERIAFTFAGQSSL